MERAFVLINCDLGSEKSLIQQIQSLENVKETHGIFGTYDIIAEIESPKLGSINQTVTEKIRRLDHVRSTNTLMGIKGQLESSIVADLIPDVIPEEKKPLDPPSEEYFDEDENDEDDEFKEK